MSAANRNARAAAETADFFLDLGAPRSAGASGLSARRLSTIAR
jgi:hypothetical protein